MSGNDNDSYISPVWAGDNGHLEARWYDNSRCYKDEYLEITYYRAFYGPVTASARSCKQAKDALAIHYGPVHSTPWDCIYSEKRHLWYHAKCDVHHIEDDPFWSTAGGVVLAIFIAAASIFVLWWISLCFRVRRFGLCFDLMRELDMDQSLVLG